MQKNEKKIINPFYETIISRRTIRRFKQKPIEIDILKRMINAARLAPSAANLQPLEFIIVNQKQKCEEVFISLRWAGYIKPEWKPAKEERPISYIIILYNNNISSNNISRLDIGLAAENIMLTAQGYNIGSCIICSFNKETIRSLLNIPNNYNIETVIALGYKSEKSVIENYTDSIEYWRDQKQILHVPKRKIDDIIHFNNF